MKENYQIYLPYQFHWRPQSAERVSKLPHKKMKTMFLWNMSKSRRLTSTFFPTTEEGLIQGVNPPKTVAPPLTDQTTAMNSL